MNKIVEILKAIFVSKFWVKAISFFLAFFVVVILNI